PVLAFRTVTYCTENEETPVIALEDDRQLECGLAAQDATASAEHRKQFGAHCGSRFSQVPAEEDQGITLVS
ncbi:MAG TPA: hypothetical protein PKI69_09970, partial [Rhodocyclaceae bacterium]|nr:hypothetical protein [Rhodocyclaceae bacterium]